MKSVQEALGDVHAGRQSLCTNNAILYFLYRSYVNRYVDEDLSLLYEKDSVVTDFFTQYRGESSKDSDDQKFLQSCALHFLGYGDALVSRFCDATLVCELVNAEDLIVWHHARFKYSLHRIVCSMWFRHKHWECGALQDFIDFSMFSGWHLAVLASIHQLGRRFGRLIMQNQINGIGQELTTCALALCKFYLLDDDDFGIENKEGVDQIASIITVAVKVYIQSMFTHFTEDQKLNTENLLTKGISLVGAEHQGYLIFPLFILGANTKREEVRAMVREKLRELERRGMLQVSLHRIPASSVAGL